MNKLTKYKKKSLSKTHKITIAFILLILTIGVGYSALVTNLSISGNLLVKKYVKPRTITFPAQIENMLDIESCMVRYEGNVTDEVNTTVDAHNVYFNRCANKRNIKFGGFCWQMIRTTENGGIKMIYNGEPDGSGECGSSRANHLGMQSINNTNYISFSSIFGGNSSIAYSSDIEYNETTGEFVLLNSQTDTWSDSNYENFLGMYTCGDSSTSCSTINKIISYKDSSSAFVTEYEMGSINYQGIAKTGYNNLDNSIASSGYMYNSIYIESRVSLGSSSYLYGSSFTYNANTNTYTLSGTTQNTIGTDLSATHYTCWNDTGQCQKIYYVYHTDNYNGYSLSLSNGKGIGDAINEMLYNNDVNKYDSDIKTVIDYWYTKNFTQYTSYLEDTVFCNGRHITSLNGWDPDGNNIVGYLYFGNAVSNNSLSCSEVTDQFSVNNNVAKLDYPVGMMSSEEALNFENALLASASSYWLMSPKSYESNMRGLYISSNGTVYDTLSSDNTMLARPVISLKNNNIIVSGDGSEANPWVIQE